MTNKVHVDGQKCAVRWKKLGNMV